MSSNMLHRIGDNDNLGQVGATFYGPLVCHVTAAPIWVSSDITLVTIVCQGQCYNVSWGRSIGNSPAINAHEKADVICHQSPTNRQKTRQCCDIILQTFD